ncbi:MAG: hypothetical protein ACI9DF_004881 [Verrucomicrobiales bacterium]
MRAHGSPGFSVSFADSRPLERVVDLADSSLNYSRKISDAYFNLLIFNALRIKERTILIRKRIFLAVRKWTQAATNGLAFRQSVGREV